MTAGPYRLPGCAHCARPAAPRARLCDACTHVALSLLRASLVAALGACAPEPVEPVEPDCACETYVGELSIDGELVGRGAEVRVDPDRLWVEIGGCTIPLAPVEGEWRYDSIPVLCGAATVSWARLAPFSADGTWIVVNAILDGRSVGFIGEVRP